VYSFSVIVGEVTLKPVLYSDNSYFYTFSVYQTLHPIEFHNESDFYSSKLLSEVTLFAETYVNWQELYQAEFLYYYSSASTGNLSLTGYDINWLHLKFPYHPYKPVKVTRTVASDRLATTTEGDITRIVSSNKPMTYRKASTTRLIKNN
jgi:hypothetical protein